MKIINSIRARIWQQVLERCMVDPVLHWKLTHGKKLSSILYLLSSLWKHRPKIVKALTILCLVCALETALVGWLLPDPGSFYFALGFLLLAIAANIPENELKGFLIDGCLALSQLCLRLAARLNGSPSQSQFDLVATICGHTSKEDPAETPVLIQDLLSILDRSTGKSVELEIPGYRIKATTVSPMDEFIEKHAGREGKPAPELTPWFAE